MRNKILFTILVSCLVVITNGCENKDEISKKYDFDNMNSLNPPNKLYCMINNNEGWTYDFSNVSVADIKKYGLEARHSKIPVKGSSRKGIMMKYTVAQDNIFMYITKKLSPKDDLKPNKKYKVRLSFDIATNQSRDKLSAKDRVFIKAGIVNEEPKERQKKGLKLINIDTGDFGCSGNDMRILGDIYKTNGTKDESYQYKSFETILDITTNEKGEAWIIIGADSGIKSKFTLYFTKIRVVFS
ncbi:hypothetical protein PV797_19680 [Clostridiaceae bacterium M8S5]|nr:hypothetical protein PV797_19680 [Clostridiaceae bacterium M8S5]